MAFKFELKQKVVIAVSGESGEIQARSEYAAAETAYLVRYQQQNGVGAEAWWQESALLPVGEPVVNS